MNEKDLYLYTCCFFGHRKITETIELKEKLSTNIENLIVEHNVHTFLFGSKSQFNTLCYKIVTKQKEKYPHIKRIYVRAEFPYINNDYRNYLLEHYEDTYYPPGIIHAGKAIYLERNRKMVDKSAFCIIYYNESFTPPKRKNSRTDLISYQPQSGTKLILNYARQKGLCIKNIRTD